MDQVFPAIFFSYPILIVIQYWQWVNLAENKAFLTERTYEITDGQVTGNTDDNNYSTIEQTNFIKSDTILNTYVLYVTKNQFFFFPFDSFNSEEDRSWFEEIYSKSKSR